MESKTSFYENLSGKFELITHKIHHETKALKILTEYFHKMKKTSEKFAKRYSKCLNPLKQLISDKNPLDSYGYSIKSIISSSEDFVKMLQKTSLRFYAEIIEPFLLFSEHYENSNKQFIKECSKILEGLTENRKKLLKAKEKYLKTHNKISENNQIKDSEKTQRKRAMSEVRDVYSEQVAILNAYINEKEPIFKKRMENIQQNEENRIEFIRKHFIDFYGISNVMGTEFINMHSGFKKVLEIINPIGDLHVFVNNISKGQKQNIFEKASFDIFEDNNEFSINSQIPKLNKSLSDHSKENSIESEGPDANEESLEFLQIIWSKNLASQAIDSSEKTRFVEILQNPLTNHRKFINELTILPEKKIKISDYENFVYIGGIVNILLDLLNNSLASKEKIGNELLILINNCEQIYFYGPRKNEENQEIIENIYLRDLVKEHIIWKNKETWNLIIMQKITKTLNQLKIAMQDEKIENPKSIVKRVLDVSAKLFKTKEKELEENAQKEAREEIGKKAVILSDLQFFGNELALFNVDNEISKEILIQFSLQNKLDHEKLYQLLSDYDSARILYKNKKNDAKMEQKLKLQKITKTMSKCENNPKIYIFKLIIPYISDQLLFRNILCISHEFYFCLKSEISKHVIRNENSLTIKKRSNLWSVDFAYIDILKLQQEYEILKQEKSKMFQATNKSLEDSIKLDISRSFFLYDENTQISITNILRCYAIFNIELEYCQGMNFLAGILYLSYKNESLAFAIFALLIKRHKLQQIYKENVPLLKMYLHHMSQILQIFLPKLHKHFLEEGINVSHFCAPWFLTAYTFALQHTKNPIIPGLLLDIFDNFILVFSLTK